MTEFQPQGFPGRASKSRSTTATAIRIRTGSLYHVVDLSNIPGKDDEWIPMGDQGAREFNHHHVEGTRSPVRWTRTRRLAKQFRYAQPQDCTRHKCVPSHNLYSVDSLRKHSNQAARLTDSPNFVQARRHVVTIAGHYGPDRVPSALARSSIPRSRTSAASCNDARSGTQATGHLRAPRYGGQPPPVG